jgi:hypothetical protein
VSQYGNLGLLTQFKYAKPNSNLNIYNVFVRLEGTAALLRGRHEFSLLHLVQADSGAHPGSYPMGIGGSFPGREGVHSHPTSAEVKKTWVYAFMLHTV